MKRLLVILILALPAATRAQLPSSELHAVHPPVVAAGETTEVVLVGNDLEELSALHFSDDRIQAERVMLPKPEFLLHAQPDGMKFRVTVPADFPESTVEVRAIGYFGLSTSRPLAIAPADRKLIGDDDESHHEPETAPQLPLEAQAYGTLDAKRTDWWKFSAKSGERLLVHCLAERIDSLADATLTLVDENGRELERDRDTIGRDPMIDFTAPADGDYWIGVHDFLYNGGPVFTYLMTVTQRPWIDAVFPPAGQQGGTADLTLFGRNLPGGSPGEGHVVDGKPIETLNVRVPIPNQADEPRFDWARPSRALLPTFEYRHDGSNAVAIGIASAPVIAAENDAEPPTFEPPCEIAARFDTDGDTDQFRFAAEKGKTYWVEAAGDRIAGHVDPYLLIEKVAGENSFTKIRDGDDAAGTGGPTFDDSSRDLALSFQADEDGEYRITAVNRFDGGGPTKTYRIAIREAQPGFDLVAVLERPWLDQRQAFPAAPLLRRGGVFPVRVLVDRKDGFDGPVVLEAEGLPPGVACPPVTVSGKESSARLVFSATPEAPAWNGTVSVTGKAKIDGEENRRPVRAGTLVHGAADYGTARLRSRLALGLPLSVSEHETTPAAIEVGNDGRFSVTVGEKLEIPVKVTSRNGVKGNLVVTPVGLRGLAKPPTINIAEKAEEGTLTLDFKPQDKVFKPEPGTWNFVLQASGTVAYRRNPRAAERAAEELEHVEALAKNNPEAEKGKAKAKQRADAAAGRSKAKNVKFATYSLPVTVEVAPAPAAEKQTP
ncbi:MAG: PPC domain-containing protein [Verrucomicrobiales bacterium]